MTWRNFRFTYVSNDEGEAIGLEAHCKDSNHGKRCRRDLRFKKWGGAEMVERRLKWWCLQSLRFTSQTKHNRCKMQRDGNAPSLADLDTMPFATK